MTRVTVAHARSPRALLPSWSDAAIPQLSKYHNKHRSVLTANPGGVPLAACIYISRHAWSFLVLDSLPEAWNSNGALQIGWLRLAGLLVFIGGDLIVPLVRSLLERFISPQVRVAYQRVVKPSKVLLGVTLALLLADIAALLLPEGDWN